MYKIALTITALLLYAPQVLAATTEEIIEAFSNNEDVQSELKTIREQHKGAKEEIQVVSLGGGCGARGCSFTNLVVMRLTTRGVNPRTYVVLAKVGGFAKKINKVTIVKLEPKNAPAGSKTLGRYTSSRLRNPM